MLTLTTTTGAAGRTIALDGELDHQTVPRLHEALAGLRLAPGERLVVELSALTFCDSSGLAGFLAAHEAASAAGAGITLANPPRVLMRMLRFTGLDSVFDTEGAAATG
ncbi:STAS domain-containing protein [Saccharothrix xinjiangensis]|uniref:Anti-sigma factor antagonist n=1 Tax=Saccharothrix xinjiangensis TaxID=204798 RepID=A0ABV9YF09_9PSEU